MVPALVTLSRKRWPHSHSAIWGSVTGLDSSASVDVDSKRQGSQVGPLSHGGQVGRAERGWPSGSGGRAGPAGR